MNLKLKRTIAILFLFTMTSCMVAQEMAMNFPRMQRQMQPKPTAPHIVAFCEVGGPSLGWSLNIDTRFAQGTYWGFGGRMGVGWVSKDYKIHNSDYGSIMSIPIALNYVLGKMDSFNTFELGIGVTFFMDEISVNDNEDEPGSVLGYLQFAYRHVPVNGGFTWRAGFTPMISKVNISNVLTFSVGYAF